MHRKVRWTFSLAASPKLIQPSSQDQANRTFHDLLTTELFSDSTAIGSSSTASIPNTVLASPSRHAPSSSKGSAIPSISTPPQTPTKRQRVFEYTSPSRSRIRSVASKPGLDSPHNEAYSTTPIRDESQRFLLSPRKTVRVVGKTPYKVLDAPDLAVRHFRASNAVHRVTQLCCRTIFTLTSWIGQAQMCSVSAWARACIFGRRIRPKS